MNKESIENILLEHNYKIGDFLGKGSYGACYKVFSARYNMDFACKVFSFSEDGRRESIIASLKSEIIALCQIDDVNVIKIYDFFEGDKSFFMILEFCEFGSIGDLLKKEKRINQADLHRYVRQIVSALKFCHEKKLSHLDIKPGNILLCSGKRIKVADFGLSHFIKDGSKMNIFSGSLAFEAPEILQRKEYDPFKADVWSFGITVYQMATGEIPFDTLNPKYLRSQISMAIEYYSKCLSKDILKIVRSCLKINPEDRPTFNDIYLMLAPDFCGSKKVIVKPLLMKGSVSKRCKRRTMSPTAVNHGIVSTKCTENVKYRMVHPPQSQLLTVKKQIPLVSAVK